MYLHEVAAREGTSPPGFLALAGHPVRWTLLSELACSDRQVRELTALAGQPQNLVSYHLGKLRAAGLVVMRRSSADGRDAYYSIDLVRCGALLAAAGAALHPGLGLVRAASWAGRRREPRCCSCAPGTAPALRWRQAICEQLAGGAVTAASAGSHPKPLHPNAVRVMRERGIDISSRPSRHFSCRGRAAVRLRGQPVRPGPGGLPGLPRSAAAGPLEHRRPGCHGRVRRRDVSGVPRLGRGPGDPDRVPAVPDRSLGAGGGPAGTRRRGRAGQRLARGRRHAARPDGD